MLTPAEITGKSFGKAIGGYKGEEVETFLEAVAADYERALGENKALQEKLEVLAETIESYRKDDVNLKAALIGAQKLGDSVLREAKGQAENMKKQALSQSRAELELLRKEIQREKQALYVLQKDAANFKNKLLSLYRNQLDSIQTIPGNTAPAAEVRPRAAAPSPQQVYQPAPQQAVYQSAPPPQQKAYQPEEYSEDDTEDDNTVRFPEHTTQAQQQPNQEHPAQPRQGEMFDVEIKDEDMDIYDDPQS